MLVKGGNIINAAHNQSSFCSFAQRFQGQKKHPTQHAEIMAVLGIDKSITSGASVYVVRINANDDFRLSKPCPMCMGALKFCGVKKVFYTLNDGHVVRIKL